MNYCTPEQAGISSRYVKAFYQALKDYHLSTHSVILARGNSIFSESYYAPFDKDFKHRMYSVSKSFISAAVGFCLQDGLLSLDDRVTDYFPTFLNEKTDDVMKSATIRDLLRMESSIESFPKKWFYLNAEDRVETYFQVSSQKYPGTLFTYDSSGSFLLNVIVEKLTGKPFLQYLQEKVLNDIGFSKDAYCLQTPGGHSFGDSGVMCTARDLLLFARFMMNRGAWDGKQYLDRSYADEALNSGTFNRDDYGFTSHGAHGYGYLIWGAPNGGFAFLGMGNQIALCDVQHDFIFIINSDNQGNTYGYEQIYEAIYHQIIDHLEDKPLPEDAEALAELRAIENSQKLFSLPERPQSPIAEKISGKKFTCAENSMGIRWFRVELDGEKGMFSYENEQGEKSFPFGFGKNLFAKFPQSGYSDLVAGAPCEGNLYDAAFSADWCEENKLRIRVQIIDKYFGNLAILLGFADESHVTLRMTKTAEAFLDEYQGLAKAVAN